MKVTWHPYKEMRLDSELAQDEDLLHLSGEDAKVVQERKYSFVAMTWHPRLRKIIVGATNLAGDILLTFDPKTRQFESCGFAQSPFYSPAASKIHKGLSLDVENDEVYFGIATLSPLPDIIRKPGGREHASCLARYHIRQKRFELLGPVETRDGRFLNYAHEFCIVDNVCFIGETDNKTRSGYMWACEV